MMCSGAESELVDRLDALESLIASMSDARLDEFRDELLVIVQRCEDTGRMPERTLRSILEWIDAENDALERILLRWRDRAQSYLMLSAGSASLEGGRLQPWIARLDRRASTSRRVIAALQSAIDALARGHQLTRAPEAAALLELVRELARESLELWEGKLATECVLLGELRERLALPE